MSAQNEITKVIRQNNEENAVHETALSSIQENGWESMYLDLVADLAAEDMAAVAKFNHAGSIVARIRAEHDMVTSRRILNTFGRTKKLNMRVLTAALKFYNEMSEYVQDIEGLYNEVLDYRVKQTHLQLVMTGELTPDERFEYLRRAVAEGLSAEKMRKLMPSASQNWHGRSHTALTTREQVLLQMQDVMGKVLNKDEHVWRKPESPAILLLQDTENVDEALRCELDETVETLRKVQDMCRELLPTLVDLQSKYLASYLKTQPAVQTAEAGNLRSVARTVSRDEEVAVTVE